MVAERARSSGARADPHTSQSTGRGGSRVTRSSRRAAPVRYPDRRQDDGGAPVRSPRGSERDRRGHRRHPGSVGSSRAPAAGRPRRRVDCMALVPSAAVSEPEMTVRLSGHNERRPDHFEVMEKLSRRVTGPFPAHPRARPRDGRPPYFRSCPGVRTERFQGRPRGTARRGRGRRRSSRGVGFFRENVEIARSVCRNGVDRTSWTAASTTGRVRGGRRGLPHPVEGGAVHYSTPFPHDVESTRSLQERALRAGACPRPWIALINNRADRPWDESFADDFWRGPPTT
jgi:hypothetical protein